MSQNFIHNPALALLLANPALRLPNMLVIRRTMGTKKTVVFSSLVIVMATISGIIFGANVALYFRRKYFPAEYCKIKGTEPV